MLVEMKVIFLHLKCQIRQCYGRNFEYFKYVHSPHSNHCVLEQKISFFQRRLLFKLLQAMIDF